MPKSTPTKSSPKRKRGRPSIRAEVLLGVKVPVEFARKFEDWAAERGLTKSEALRQILAAALRVE